MIVFFELTKRTADTGRPENGLSEVNRMLNVSSVGRIDTFKLILLLLLIVVRRRRCVLANIVKKTIRWQAQISALAHSLGAIGGIYVRKFSAFPNSP